MGKFKTFTGIVLRHIKLDEAEKLFIIITPTGKVKTIAKGVRKITSKNAGHLELFTHAHIQTVEGNSGRYIVTNSVSIDRFDVLAQHIEKYAIAMFACEVVDKFSQENDDTAYHKLLYILNHLRNSSYSNNDILFVLVQLSMIIGIYPSLELCAMCGNDNTPNDTCYSYDNGGIICQECRDDNAISLSLYLVKILRNAYRHHTGVMPYVISKEYIKFASDIIYQQMVFNSHEQLKTWKMIQDIVLK